VNIVKITREQFPIELYLEALRLSGRLSFLNLIVTPKIRDCFSHSFVSVISTRYIFLNSHCNKSPSNSKFWGSQGRWLQALENGSITPAGKIMELFRLFPTGKFFAPGYYLHEIVETDCFLTVLSHLDRVTRCSLSGVFPVFVKHELKGVSKFKVRKYGPTTQPPTDVIDIINWSYSNYFVFHILIPQGLR
jgi:hypothetical protein